MAKQDTYAQIARLKGRIDQVMLETARAGRDVNSLVQDLRVILEKARRP